MLTFEQAQTFYAEAEQLLAKDKYAEAITLLEQAAPVFEQNADWEKLVTCLILQSECLRNDGKYDKAIQMAEQALGVSLENLGHQHLETAHSYLNLGLCNQSKGNFLQAIAYIEQALSIYTLIDNEPNVNYCKCYNNLGICHANLSDFNLAIAYFNKALDIDKIKVGERNEVIAKSYSNLGICYRYLGEYDKAIDFIKQAIAINLYNFGEQNSGLARYHSTLGTCYLDYGNYALAIKHNKKSLEIRQALFGKSHPITATCYANLGNCYQKTGDYSLAINNYLSNIAINFKSNGANHFNTAITYFNLGNCYALIENYTLAFHYLEQSLAMRLSIFGKQHRSTAQSFNGLGVCALEMKNMPQAFKNLKEALNIRLAIFGKEHPDTAISYLNLGNYYKNTDNYAQALDCYQEFLNINRLVFGDINPNTALAFNALAAYYQELRMTGEALYYLQKALHSLGLSVSDDDYYPIPQLIHYNSSLKLLDTLISKAVNFQTQYIQTQQFQDLTASLAHFQGADKLIDQMRQSYKAEDSKLTLAENSKHKVYDEGLEVAWILDRQRQAIGLQAFQSEIERVNQTYGYAIPNNPIDASFHFSEKSKAVLLHASIKDANAKTSAGLPPELVQQEYDLRIEQNHLEQKLIEEKQKPVNQQNHSKIMEWEGLLFESKQQYDNLIEHLEKEYPDYYRLKYDLKAADIAEIQATLDPQTAMISCVVSEKYLYTFVITANGSHWLQQHKPADLEGLIEDFLYAFEPFGKEDFLVYGHDLYRHLIHPLVKKGWLNDINRLVIIPDGILSRIPFEALLTKAVPTITPYDKLPYLIKRYVISYHYSATLWHHQQKVSKTKQEKETFLPSADKGSENVKGDFIGFAPIYSNTITTSEEHDIDLDLEEDIYKKLGIEKPKEPSRIQYHESAGILRSKVEGKDYVELQYSEQEVRHSGMQFAEKGKPARILLHQSATLDNFKSLVGQYRYVLIAAHADVDDQQPERTGIIFSPNEADGKGIFYMGDAYNLRLQAEVVVLSCCETGLGKVKKGEGTLALNRGFLYSGAKNVVYTLFKVYDKESSQLTTGLFRHLIAGKTCATALHKAKLRLIRQGLMPIKWAGYVMVGE